MFGWVFYCKMLSSIIIFYLHCASGYVRIADGLSLVPVLDMQDITNPFDISLNSPLSITLPLLLIIYSVLVCHYYHITSTDFWSPRAHCLLASPLDICPDHHFLQMSPLFLSYHHHLCAVPYHCCLSSFFFTII